MTGTINLLFMNTNTDTLLFVQPDHFYTSSLGVTLIILPVATVICFSQQFTSNKARGKTTKGKRLWANKLGGRLNNCGLSGAWGKHNPVVYVTGSEFVYVWASVCVHVLAANTKNKSVPASCISAMVQLLLVFKPHAGVSALVFVELSLRIQLLLCK